MLSKRLLPHTNIIHLSLLTNTILKIFLLRFGLRGASTTQVLIEIMYLIHY